MSGVFEGVTTGSPIQLLIENVDHRSKDYGDIVDKFRPGHADFTYFKKYGIRDHRGLDNVIAVIGDGAISAGMAYEAMNNAGASKTKMIVILNDNDMSIARPVGAMGTY